ncbi:c-type cytochrome [Methylobacterium sp. CM6257]|jgi:mono/diheme cytochrome c family protein
MRGRARLLGTTAALLLLAGPTGAEEAGAARGQAFARAVCARCHAIRARGASPMHAAPPFRALAGRFPIDDLADVLVEGVERRHPSMPDVRLAPSEAADLTAYLKTLRR